MQNLDRFKWWNPNLLVEQKKYCFVVGNRGSGEKYFFQQLEERKKKDLENERKQKDY